MRKLLKVSQLQPSFGLTYMLKGSRALRKQGSSQIKLNRLFYHLKNNGLVRTNENVNKFEVEMLLANINYRLQIF